MRCLGDREFFPLAELEEEMCNLYLPFFQLMLIVIYDFRLDKFSLAPWMLVVVVFFQSSFRLSEKVAFVAVANKTINLPFYTRLYNGSLKNRGCIQLSLGVTFKVWEHTKNHGEHSFQEKVVANLDSPLLCHYPGFFTLSNCVFHQTGRESYFVAQLLF